MRYFTCTDTLSTSRVHESGAKTTETLTVQTSTIVNLCLSKHLAGSHQKVSYITETSKK